jgi:hypothetical protein
MCVKRWNRRLVVVTLWGTRWRIFRKHPRGHGLHAASDSLIGYVSSTIRYVPKTKFGTRSHYSIHYPFKRNRRVGHDTKKARRGLLVPYAASAQPTPYPVLHISLKLHKVTISP